MLIKWTLAFVLLLALIGCQPKNDAGTKLTDWVPQQTERLLRMQSFPDAVADFGSNDLMDHLQRPALLPFFSDSELMDLLAPQGSSLLCYQQGPDGQQEYTFIARGIDPVVLDSIHTDQVKDTAIGGRAVKQIETATGPYFSFNQDSIHVLSNSQNIIEDLLSKSNTSAPIVKGYHLKPKSDLALFMPVSEVPLNDTTSIRLGTQSVMELKLYPEITAANGMILNRDSLPALIDVFKGLRPEPENMAAVMPVTAHGFTRLAYDDVNLLEENLSAFQERTVSLHPLLDAISELALAPFQTGEALILNSTDPDLSEEELLGYISPLKTIRGIETWNIQGMQNVLDGFQPLLVGKEWGFGFRWESYFILVSNQTLLEEYITALTNGQILNQTAYYQDTALQLSRSASLSFYAMNGNIVGPMAAFLSSDGSQLKQFPLAVAQLSYDRDFAHLNLICKQASSAQMETGIIAQRFSQNLENALQGAPSFFSNHRTGGKDIAVQDVSNQLYLLGSGGKILWKKKLDGPIMGAIREVDLLRNGKKQLAFNTAKRVYVIDRLGNNVSPFPLKFKDDITQPVAIFDYDNNRKYRFLVCQDNQLLMYDSKGKTVKGFKFKQTESRIVQTPKHIRMGNKDYILIPETNGKLNILSRIGKSRIQVKRQFDFAAVPITREGDKFVVITKQNSKESIDQSGSVSSVALNVSKDYYFTTLGPNKVTLDDNLMRINGKLVELPFGVYSKPQLHRVHQTTYVSITALQENKLYLYSIEGVLIEGFPVYGSTPPDVADVDRSRRPALVTQGGPEEVLLYKIQ